LEVFGCSRLGSLRYWFFHNDYFGEDSVNIMRGQQGDEELLRQNIFQMQISSYEAISFLNYRALEKWASGKFEHSLSRLIACQAPGHLLYLPNGR
jgi:hypothetical protein